MILIDKNSKNPRINDFYKNFPYINTLFETETSEGRVVKDIDSNYLNYILDELSFVINGNNIFTEKIIYNKLITKETTVFGFTKLQETYLSYIAKVTDIYSHSDKGTHLIRCLLPHQEKLVQGHVDYYVEDKLKEHFNLDMGLAFELFGKLTTIHVLNAIDGREHFFNRSSFLDCCKAIKEMKSKINSPDLIQNIRVIPEPLFDSITYNTISLFTESYHMDRTILHKETGNKYIVGITYSDGERFFSNNNIF